MPNAVEADVVWELKLYLEPVLRLRRKRMCGSAQDEC